jgi:signal transduction histidine kinase
VLAPGEPVFAAGPAAEAMAPLDRDVLALTREEGRAVIEHLARARAVLNVEAVAGRLQALIALPLRQESTFYGALWLAFDQPHTFGEAEISFITTLAGQAAVAVANVRLFEAAEQGRQRLAAILASTPDGVIVTDHTNRVLLVNPAAEAAFGLSGKPVVGCPVAQVLGSAHRELAVLLTAPAGNARAAPAGSAPAGGNGAVPAEEAALLPATGEFTSAQGRTLFASASPIISADGSTLGRVCVLRDVTHFKQLDDMKSEFVATVSHDLRAPLTLIRGYATMLPMVGALTEKQKFFADKILSSSEQMTALINDLLDLGRIEAGVGLVRETVLPQQLIDEVIERVAPQAASGQLKLRVEAPANLPTLSGDPVLLRQALTNLVENAIKYTGVGGEVVLRARLAAPPPGPAGLVFAVSDTGVGVAPADQLHLFEKFFRVRQRGRTQAKGSGLGLAIVRSIVERHGGRVWVDSQLGAGSTFSMVIPLQAEAVAG